jgi:hypothetical protein
VNNFNFLLAITYRFWFFFWGRGVIRLCVGGVLTHVSGRGDRVGESFGRCNLGYGSIVATRKVVRWQEDEERAVNLSAGQAASGLQQQQQSSTHAASLDPATKLKFRTRYVHSSRPESSKSCVSHFRLYANLGPFFPPSLFSHAIGYNCLENPKNLTLTI